jgi:chromate transport protein ChrA
MNKSTKIHKILGIIFIFIGIILYPTPIPGSTLLVVLGFIWIIGKKRTLHFLKEKLNKKLFKFLKIKKIIKKHEKFNENK